MATTTSCCLEWEDWRMEITTGIDGIFFGKKIKKIIKLINY
jgi:hypothetical protein